jgi:DNA primase
VKIPQAFIDELLSRINLIDIIETRIQLKKTSKVNYSALCPFHHEKTPSFSVNESKQFFHCFGCKASGNAITFLMNFDKLSFLEAVEILATKAGIPLPETTFGKLPDTRPNTEILEECALYYEEELKKSHGAQNYLKQRGLNAEIIKRFRIGYAPNGWDRLSTKFLQGKEANLLETGMIIKKEPQGKYDRFRNRIMFPIRNRRGKIVAFGGRTLETALPKYLNSPDSPLFHKSQELYGLFEVLETNKVIENFIVVEGYLDVIALHQHGFSETVATLGTAISLRHIQILLRFSENLIFCFDGDIAGKNAAWRALEIAMPLMHSGMNMKFLFLPSQDDPDSYIRKNGSIEFKSKLQSAIPLSEFFLQKLTSETEINSLAGKTRFVHLADKYLDSLPRGIFRELIFEQVAKKIGFSKEKLQEILEQPKSYIKQAKIPAIEPPKIPSPVRLAISLLLQAPRLLSTATVPKRLANMHVKGMEFLTKLIIIIQKNPEQTTGSLLEYFKEQNEMALLTELATQDLLIPEKAWPKELQGALNWIAENEIEIQIQELLAKGKQQGLTSDEKKMLQNLLILQKQL